ncbi:MAG: CDC48 family AAA ATPase [Sulfolobales archaeon]|nr:CDC48 family AAA ATPase [Sulfolobales archaeon]MDW8082404.1 CDC48 family AAA ATPase [Sulfolobales archaeon]
MSSNEVELRVESARPHDVGRKIARVPRKHMEILGINYGDFIEIEGTKSSAILQVRPVYPEDEGTNIIRIDGLTREALGVSVGDYVTVRKVKVVKGVRVVFAPIDFRLETPEQVAGIVKERLLNKAVKKGEIIFVHFPYYAEPFRFVVKSCDPAQVVFIDYDTRVDLSPEPVTIEALERLRGVPRVTWEDIGDLEEVKERIREMVELPLKHPEFFKHLGIEPPKGVLLYGPPGVGKTLLAKALANEIGAYFIAINGPEIMSKYYGESEARLREIFEEAQKNSPAIIFIDEIDAIAPKREEVVGEVEKRVVAQLLALMDGLKERGKVIVIGATNRVDAVDPALRRPGRFDREIEIPPPDKNARKSILEVHTRNIPLVEDVNIDTLANITYGFTGADLAALVKEAAMNALRRFLRTEKIDLSKPVPFEVLEKLKVTQQDFLDSLKVVHPTLMREVLVEVPEVRWDDIGGLDSVKQALREAVEWPLKYPEVFEKMGVRPPRGILLYGPPGCGKTLLAKAVATEANANFIAIKGPEILSKWVGESEKAVREIFRRARQVAPSIIFFDEVDAIVPTRGMRHDTEVTDRIVNQLLAEMDGIQTLKNVVVIGATNRVDLIDPALLRPGRFDRVIYVPPPDRKARYEILKIHTRGVPLAKDIDLEKLAEMTEGYSGADLEALVREAVMMALREKFAVRPIENRYFLEAMKIVKPSLSSDVIGRYERLYSDLKKIII